MLTTPHQATKQRGTYFVQLVSNFTRCTMYVHNALYVHAVITCTSVISHVSNSSITTILLLTIIFTVIDSKLAKGKVKDTSYHNKKVSFWKIIKR